MFLTGFYHFLKYICLFLDWLFYEKSTTIGKQFFNLKRPCIVVANHPNTLLDPVNIVIRLPQKNHFLGNAGLFAHPFTDWLFRNLWTIPIKRQQDKVNHVKNSDSFKQCDEFLLGGGCLFIAPEGSSWQERHLREIKTGTARIALSVESKSNFQLGLNIQPFGQTYTKQGHFWSRLFIEGVAPIRVADFKEIFEKDYETAVSAITKEIEIRLRSAMIDTDDAAQDILLARCEKLLIGEKIYSDEASFRQSQKLLQELKSLKKTSFQEYENLQNAVNQFFIKLKKEGASYEGLTKKHNILFLLLCFPLFLVGSVSNVLPFLCTYFIWKKATPNGYDATVQYAGGLILFSIFYTVQKNILQSYGIDFPFFWVVYWLFSIVGGAFALRYFINLRHYFEYLGVKNKQYFFEERERLIRTLQLK